jgi:hypothetical protein
MKKKVFRLKRKAVKPVEVKEVVEDKPKKKKKAEK